jgi:sulfate adenylyltransferase subunit 1
MIKPVKRLWKIVKKKDISKMTTMNQNEKTSLSSNLASNSTVLRIVTAGSVDNGKSTLIGRLLYDSKKILQDHLENIEAAKERYGNEEINLAFLTDGLRAEREQGITIDVAYRYFTSDKRKYILADCPGHIQYTKNMFTGASTADAAIILIDAKLGFIEQSKRHTYLSLLLGVEHVIFAVNKMDLLEYSEEEYNKICNDVREWLPGDANSKYHFLPISALEGDNIVNKSENMPWFTGESLINFLDNLQVSANEESQELRYPVQWVVRPQSKEFHDFRGYAGTLASGSMKVGDEVTVLPSGLTSKIKEILNSGRKVDEVTTGLSPTIQLEDDLDISRGSVICSKENSLKTDNNVKAIITWLNEKPAETSKRYWMKHGKRWVKIMISDLSKELNLHTLVFEDSGSNKLNLNGIAEINIQSSEPLYYDVYKDNKTTGSFIIADETSFETVGAGMII